MIYKTIILKKEVNQFMLTSGDYNPIHWDKAYATRQLFGTTIIHGALVIKKFLNFYFKNNNYDILSFNCSFIKPVYSNEKIYFKYFYKKNSIECVVVNNKNVELIFFNFSYKVKKFKKTKSFTKIKFKCLEINKYQIKNLKNLKRKFIKKKDGNKNIFFSILENLSRIVGVEIPGKNSLFINFSLNKKYNNKNYYEIENFSENTNLIDTVYFYDDYEIRSKSLLLEKPKDQLLISNVNNFIKNKKKNNFRKNIIIIGGSRGLGLITSIYFLLSNNNVTVTYNNYFDYIKILHKKFNKKKLRSIKINLENNFHLSKLLKILDKFDYIFYFASPKILSNKNQKFDKKYYNLLYFFYVKVVIKILKNLKLNSRIFIPSTIFLNKKNNYFKEYIMAKKNMEKVCNYYNYKNSKIWLKRLPAFETDQNIELIKKKIKNKKIYEFINYIKRFCNSK